MEERFIQTDPSEITNDLSQISESFTLPKLSKRYLNSEAKQKINALYSKVMQNTHKVFPSYHFLIPLTRLNPLKGQSPNQKNKTLKWKIDLSDFKTSDSSGVQSSRSNAESKLKGQFKASSFKNLVLNQINQSLTSRQKTNDSSLLNEQTSREFDIQTRKMPDITNFKSSNPNFRELLVKDEEY